MTGLVGAASLAPKSYPLVAGGQELVLPYQGSHPLEGEQGVVRRVVIAIHGAGYNPQEAYNAVVIATGRHTGATDPLCIIAPQFLRSSVLPAVIPDNLLYWNNFPFRGTSSARYGPAANRVTISVFDVLDRLLETVTDPGLFPNLETVVVAGFSAGGQTVNRYAIAGRLEGTLPQEREFHLRYMVLSPSSYLYLSPERDPDGDGQFTVPQTGCSGYNDWGYGLNSLYSYPTATGESTMREHYPKRFVFYLVGGNDNNPADPSLATGCQSMLQGPHRVARAEIYFSHLLEVYGPGIRDYQSLHIVPGAGHSFSQMLNSDLGRRFLLDRDETDTDGDGCTDWAEWIFGSDALDPSDRFNPEWSLVSAPLSYGLSWEALPDRHYTILQSNDPGQGFGFTGSLPPPEAAKTLSWPVTPTGTPQFLKIEGRLR
ncbi:MAG: hypothetical protein AB3N33_06500 [Puniceicoccaceae bacterium]